MGVVTCRYPRAGSQPVPTQLWRAVTTVWGSCTRAFWDCSKPRTQRPQQWYLFAVLHEEPQSVSCRRLDLESQGGQARLRLVFSGTGTHKWENLSYCVVEEINFRGREALSS
eukprot:5170173-Pyramimonas_sp.AAC.1